MNLELSVGADGAIYLMHRDKTNRVDTILKVKLDGTVSIQEEESRVRLNGEIARNTNIRSSVNLVDELRRLGEGK